MNMTFRRHYVDKYLTGTIFQGCVLDVGGKKINKRGMFRPPSEGVEAWKYLNIDETTAPDYLCSAEMIPTPDGAFDIVLMSEVLEHLENPAAILCEANRVLKTNGKLIITMPFLYPVHSDPGDYQRWTASRISSELIDAGFAVERIEPMGSIFAVIYDLLYVALGAASKNRGSYRNRFMKRLIMPPLATLFMRLDSCFMYKANIITTGYYVVGRKK